jgi:hypothetical protein
VIWSERGKGALRGYLPHGRRQWALLAMGLFLAAVAAQVSWRGVPAVH